MQIHHPIYDLATKLYTCTLSLDKVYNLHGVYKTSNYQQVELYGNNNILATDCLVPILFDPFKNGKKTTIYSICVDSVPVPKNCQVTIRSAQYFMTFISVINK